MYGLNAFSLILFTVINLAANSLLHSTEAMRNRVIRTLCWMLLLINICRYALSPLRGNGVIIPVEFSTVAYFAVPVIVLTARKKLQIWAAYSGLIAGFCYYLAMILAGGPIYDAYPHDVIYVSMFCHGTLYLCGLVLTKTRCYPDQDRFLLLGGIAYVAAQAIVFRPLMQSKERMFIYELLDGKYFVHLFPQPSWYIVRPIYYVLLTLVILLTIKGFLALNHAMNDSAQWSRKQRKTSISAIEKLQF